MEWISDYGTSVAKVVIMEGQDCMFYTTIDANLIIEES